MRRLMTAAATAALCLAPAAANEIADECRAYVDANGGDASGCDCLGAAAESDAALAEALKAIDTPEDLEAADESTKAAIAACYPNSEPQG